MRAYIAGILAYSCFLAATPAGGAVDPAAQLLSQTIVDNAYHRSRMTALSKELSAREAQILLQFALELEPANTHTLKLLVEAAEAGGDAGAERDALRKLIALDH